MRRAGGGQEEDEVQEERGVRGEEGWWEGGVEEGRRAGHIQRSRRMGKGKRRAGPTAAGGGGGGALDSHTCPCAGTKGPAGHSLWMTSAWEVARPARSTRQVNSTEAFMVGRGARKDKGGVGRRVGGLLNQGL